MVRERRVRVAEERDHLRARAAEHVLAEERRRAVPGVEHDRERLRTFSAESQDRCLVEQATAALGADTLAKLQAMEPVSVPSEEAVGEPNGAEEVEV